MTIGSIEPVVVNVPEPSTIFGLTAVALVTAFKRKSGKDKKTVPSQLN